MLLVISGGCLYRNISVAKQNVLSLEQIEAILKEYSGSNPNDLTAEQIKEVLKEYAESNPRSWSEEEINERAREYVESTYGSGTSFRIVSYGESGIGYVNHETGEVILYVTDTGKEK